MTIREKSSGELKYEVVDVYRLKDFGGDIFGQVTTRGRVEVRGHEMILNKSVLSINMIKIRLVSFTTIRGVCRHHASLVP